MRTWAGRATYIGAVIALGAGCGAGSRSSPAHDDGSAKGAGSGDAATVGAEASLPDAGDSASELGPETSTTMDSGAGLDGSADGEGSLEAGASSVSPFCMTRPANEQVLQVAVGGARECAILSGGVLKCWGCESGGYLGLGDNSCRGSSPGQMGAALPAVDLGTGKEAVAVTMGILHVCVLLSDGSVKCFGGNSYGQLGLGDTNDRGNAPGQMGDNLPAVDLGTGRTAVAVSAGSSHTCAVLDDGSVKCWGGNSSGSLGLGDTVNRGGQPGQMGDNLPPVSLGSARMAVAVSAGSAHDDAYSHTCAVLDDGSAKCWGYNDAGELGLGDRVSRGVSAGQMGDALPAVDLGTGRHALSISAGYFFTCALLDDASVKCWGTGDELGLGRPDSRGLYPDQMGDNLPAVDLGTGSTAVAVSAGYASACALLSNGRFKCWGDNYEGQLGQGDFNSRGTAPREMGDYLPPVDIGSCVTSTAVVNGDAQSGGGVTVCALLSNATVKCWGVGESLGLGDQMGRGGQPGEMGDDLPTVSLFADDAYNAGDAAVPADAGQSDDAATDALAKADAPSTCDDNIKDGNETDIDCGGSCAPCGLGQGCLVNTDCGSWPGCDDSKGGCACDAVSKTCVADHCVDHQQDLDETAVDCGGGDCTGCGVGQACVLDSDCASDACDLLSSKCAQSTCVDHKWDGSETALDCGGGVCPGCAVGLACLLDGDCQSEACDAVSLVCVSDACFDHRQDGSETDVDCGGSTCAARCAVGQHCLANSDCSSGHTCLIPEPRLCQ